MRRVKASALTIIASISLLSAAAQNATGEAQGTVLDSIVRVRASGNCLDGSPAVVHETGFFVGSVPYVLTSAHIRKQLREFCLTNNERGISRGGLDDAITNDVKQKGVIYEAARIGADAWRPTYFVQDDARHDNLVLRPNFADGKANVPLQVIRPRPDIYICSSRPPRLQVVGLPGDGNDGPIFGAPKCLISDQSRASDHAPGGAPGVFWVAEGFIEHGVSGAPVVDLQANAAVAMVIADSGQGRSFYLPLSLVDQNYVFNPDSPGASTVDVRRDTPIAQEQKAEFVRTFETSVPCNGDRTATWVVEPTGRATDGWKLIFDSIRIDRIGSTGWDIFEKGPVGDTYVVKVRASQCEPAPASVGSVSVTLAARASGSEHRFASESKVAVVQTRVSAGSRILLGQEDEDKLSLRCTPARGGVIENVRLPDADKCGLRVVRSASGKITLESMRDF